MGDPFKHIPNVPFRSKLSKTILDVPFQSKLLQSISDVPFQSKLSKTISNIKTRGKSFLGLKSNKPGKQTIFGPGLKKNIQPRKPTRISSLQRNRSKGPDYLKGTFFNAKTTAPSQNKSTIRRQPEILETSTISNKPKTFEKVLVRKKTETEKSVVFSLDEKTAVLLPSKPLVQLGPEIPKRGQKSTKGPFTKPNLEDKEFEVFDAVPATDNTKSASEVEYGSKIVIVE